MTRLLAFALAALLPLAAVAAPAPPPRDRAGEDERPRRKEAREKVKKRLRVFRAVELADALSLPEAKALELSNAMAKFDDRREPLRDQLDAARETARKAAKGDAAALAALDGAMASAADARKKMADVDVEEYRALSQLVPADQRGKLGLFLFQFPQKVHRLVREARRGGGD